MADMTRTVVTPRGVRDGDRATLEALCARRGASVLAYCECVCESGLAEDATVEAFARFRAEVATAPHPDQLRPEALLMSCTRSAAAGRAPYPPSRVARRLGARRTGRDPCELMPTLLAARADRALSPDDLGRLERHLERCRA